jgi:hypothetical protein
MSIGRSSSIKFKIRLTKKQSLPISDIEEYLRKSIEDIFYSSTPSKDRSIKILTNSAGYNEFEKALKEELQKHIYK